MAPSVTGAPVVPPVTVMTLIPEGRMFTSGHVLTNCFNTEHYLHRILDLGPSKPRDYRIDPLTNMVVAYPDPLTDIFPANNA